MRTDFEYGCPPRRRREIRKIAFDHLEILSEAWLKHFGGNRA
jgi:hypothetical protein